MKWIRRLWCHIRGHKPNWEDGTIWLDQNCKVNMLTHCDECKKTLMIKMSSEK